VKDYEDLEL